MKMYNNTDFDFCIVITTYNRPLMLNNLLSQIDKQKEKYNIKLIVFDDASSEIYDLPDWVTYIKFYPNNGKKYFWKIIDMSFRYIKNINSKYYIYLQDDVEICDNFFNTLVQTYENIEDDDKICLNFLTDSRVNKTNWTNYFPVDLGKIIKTQWVELHFIAERKFFELIDFKINHIPLSRWDKDENLSSGVGHQLSIKLNNLKKNMYHTKKSLVFHGTHNSFMNHNERIINKLITN